MIHAAAFVLLASGLLALVGFSDAAAMTAIIAGVLALISLVAFLAVFAAIVIGGALIGANDDWLGPPG